MKRTLTAAIIVAVCAGAPIAAFAARSHAPARGITDMQPASPGMSMPGMSIHAMSLPKGLAPIVAKARLATAKYATSLAQARKGGYIVNVTRMIPDMGWHFLNPKIAGFNASTPPILVYVKHGTTWQLVAFEWVFTKKPAKAPLPGATYGSFAAACHYVDGTFVPAKAETDCAKTSPETGAAFGFWHPDFVTLHVWAWYPNPDGIYAGMNPLVHPFN